jgi:hypothetical protein
MQHRDRRRDGRRQRAGFILPGAGLFPFLRRRTDRGKITSVRANRHPAKLDRAAKRKEGENIMKTTALNLATDESLTSATEDDFAPRLLTKEEIRFVSGGSNDGGVTDASTSDTTSNSDDIVNGVCKAASVAAAVCSAKNSSSRVCAGVQAANAACQLAPVVSAGWKWLTSHPDPAPQYPPDGGADASTSESGTPDAGTDAGDPYADEATLTCHA